MGPQKRSPNKNLNLFRQILGEGHTNETENIIIIIEGYINKTKFAIIITTTVTTTTTTTTTQFNQTKSTGKKLFSPTWSSAKERWGVSISTLNKLYLRCTITPTAVMPD